MLQVIVSAHVRFLHHVFNWLLKQVTLADWRTLACLRDCSPSVLTWTQFPHSLTDDLPLFSRQFPGFIHLFWEHHSTIGPIVSISPSQSASAVVHCSTQRAAIADRSISPWRLRVGWKWSPKTAGHAVMAGLAMPGSARTKDPFSKLQRCATPHALPYNVGNETTILTLFADPRGSYRGSCGNLRSTFSF